MIIYYMVESLWINAVILSCWSMRFQLCGHSWTINLCFLLILEFPPILSIPNVMVFANYKHLCCLYLSHLRKLHCSNFVVNYNYLYDIFFLGLCVLGSTWYSRISERCTPGTRLRKQLLIPHPSSWWHFSCVKWGTSFSFHPLCNGSNIYGCTLFKWEYTYLYHVISYYIRNINFGRYLMVNYFVWG
jgi:hypothetical protein